MNFKIVNKQKCIDELSIKGYKSLLDSLDWIGFQGDKHIEIPLMYEDTFVSLTMLSFGENDVEYIYNCIIKK